MDNVLYPIRDYWACNEVTNYDPWWGKREIETQPELTQMLKGANTFKKVVISVCQLCLSKSFFFFFRRGIQQVVKNVCLVLNSLLNKIRSREKEMKRELLSMWVSVAQRCGRVPCKSITQSDIQEHPKPGKALGQPVPRTGGRGCWESFRNCKMPPSWNI